MKKPSAAKWILILVCLTFIFGGQYFLPPILGLSPKAMGALCIFLGTMTLLCTVDTMWPSCVAIIAVVTNGIYSYSDAMRLSLGHWIVAFVLFVTLLTYALRKSGFLKRAAIWMIGRPVMQKGPKFFISGYLLATMVVSWFVDPVTTLFVMVAVLEEIFAVIGVKKGDKLARDMVFSVFVIDSIASSCTPFSHVNAVLTCNMLTADFGIEYSMANFVLYGVITGLIFLVLYLVFFFLVLKPDCSKLAAFDSKKFASELEPMQDRERKTLIIYVISLVLWISPGVLSFILPGVADFLNSLGMIFPCIFGSILMCLVYDKEGKPLLDFMDGLKNGVAWSAVILVSGTMLLGTMFSSAELGIVDALTTAIAPMISGIPSMLIVIIVTFVLILLTNFCNNTVCQTLIYAVTVPLIMSGAISGVHAMAFCALLGMACNVSIMTPVACSHAAIFSSTGWCKASDQFKLSIPVSLIGVLFCALIVYPIAALLL